MSKEVKELEKGFGKKESPGRIKKIEKVDGMIFANNKLL